MLESRNITHRKLGLVWDKATGKDEIRFGILEKQARDGKAFRGRLQHKQKLRDGSELAGVEALY